ncbi:FtsH protease activity modulator HflK [Sphingomicrobium lutaoense]|uniref:Protein HflK n=1 Tax=Sphingomicrobium lutaoense TaxID=515949 RepID=A0A839Z6P9_9SPHN|nr:FtsH protease activity modulator HflK [Sphingomicrobium lutaoense]MBB3764414.1 membrane protease subunit HflK [Sphingomicrobium lutaoense]
MSIFPRGLKWGLFSENKGPWGSGPKGGDDGKGDKPGGPWKKPTVPPPGGGRQLGNVSSLDDWLRKNKGRFGGGGKGGGPGQLPGLPSGNLLFWGLIAFGLLWLAFTSIHRIAPAERGVILQMGRYAGTLNPGIGFTLPAPFASVTKVNVEEIHEIDLGTDSAETLMLTGDENIIDIAYQVRWNIRDPEQFEFEIANQEDTIRQVAESAMRQVIAQSSLQDAIGDGRSEIEAAVRQEMQATLDSYDAGVRIQGVAIKQADPPEEVNDAFKEVTAAQQDAQSYINQARAYALQLTAKAQGEAEAFDKVYEEYRLAPRVTRRRMYYETMERVLQGVDKTIIEAPGVTPYLPLPEVNRRRSAPASPQASQSGGGGQ